MPRLLRILLQLTILVTLIPPARACIWYKGTTLEGAIVSLWGRSEAFQASALLRGREINRSGDRFNAERLEIATAIPPAALLNILADEDESPTGWPVGMNEAVSLIFGGKPAEAAAQLTALDRKFPDNYWICANLAAACELSGNLPEALRWVEKALTINPGAHDGTEWMHASVIRARMALEKDPAWLRTHTISGIPVEGDVPRDFTLTAAGQPRTLEDIQRALMAHSFARLIFVKPKDAVAASLLTELARVEARQFAVENGLAMLALAEKYGSNEAPALRRHWEALLPGPLRTWLYDNAQTAAVFGVCLFLLVLVVAYYFIARRRDARRKAAATASLPPAAA